MNNGIFISEASFPIDEGRLNQSVNNMVVHESLPGKRSCYADFNRLIIEDLLLLVCMFIMILTFKICRTKSLSFPKLTLVVKSLWMVLLL